jgi:hypothetical protein
VRTVRRYRRKTDWLPEEERGLYVTCEQHHSVDLGRLVEAVLVHAFTGSVPETDSPDVPLAIHRRLARGSASHRSLPEREEVGARAPTQLGRRREAVVRNRHRDGVSTVACSASNGGT